MTSSNAAATDEGPAAISRGSPPPTGAETSATIVTSASPDISQVPAPEPPAAGESVTLKNTELDSDVGASASQTRLDSSPRLEGSTSVEPATQPQPNSPPTQPPNELDTDMPSPPTVSPLSTPAATNINVDDSLPDDALTKLTADHPSFSLTQGPSGFGSALLDHAQSTNKLLSASEGMELAETFMPEQSSYQRRPQVEAIATTDPDPNAADYSTHSMLSGMRLSQGSIDPGAYIMNIAPQGPLFQDPGPSLIDPSAVSLHSFTQDSDVLMEPSSASGSQKLESFARIEFADSTFQMTTYTVIIGRDQQAMNQARADERREAAYRRKCEDNERNGLPPPTPITHDRGKFSKSYVSEEGGMLGPELSDGDQEVRPPKKRRPSLAVQSSAGEDNASGDRVQSNRQYVSHTPGAAAVDLATLQTSPEHIPFIGIHSPGPDIASKTKGISRQHLKIQFNKTRGVFEGIALHKNGFFCEDVLYGLDKPATLRSGDRLQIKDVEFFFVINGVQLGMTGGEDEDVGSSKLMSVGGKEISLDFEHSDHENFRDTSEELSDVENVPSPVIEPAPTPTPAPASASASASAPVPEPQPQPEPASVPERSAETLDPVSEPRPSVEEESKPQPELRQESAPPQALMGDPEEQLLRLQQIVQQQQHHELARADLDMLSELPPEFALPDIPRRRGPGRPPKDGIMSKRERRLLKKQLQETSKKTLPQESQEEKIKRPVGRPRKNPVPEDGEREKRKYNKKKREDGEDGSDAEKQRKEKKDKKVRPKSPPLDLRIEDYTAEQLQKPTKNYGVLIDEALTNGPPDGLTLKQIYKRITARYPWFYFTAETKGWESSVRHNLIGNEAFKKDEETGLWSRVPGVELDAGKKRKASSPDRLLGTSHLHPHLAHAPYFQNNPYANSSTVPYGRGLPTYAAEQSNAQPGFSSAGQNTQAQTTTPTTTTTTTATTPAQPASQPVFPAHTPAPAQLPPGYGSLAVPRPANTAQQSTYSSPYARPPPPPPPPPTNAPAKPDTNVANGQTPAASSSAQSAVPAQQQQPRPSAVTPGPRGQLSPEIERAIVQFSANMLVVISKQTPHAAKIIEAATNHIRGLPVTERVPGFESVETTLVNAMQGMITDIMRKHRHPTSASPAPSAPRASSIPSAPVAPVAPVTTVATVAPAAPAAPAAPVAPVAPVQPTSTPSPAPNSVEAEIQRRLRNFRESMVAALKTKTDKAEIIVDSAINRAQGLPHVDKIQGWEGADRLMVKSVTQIIAEARSAHSLKMGNASPTPAPAPTQTLTPAPPAVGISRTPASQPAPPAPRAEPAPSSMASQPPINSTIQPRASNAPLTATHAPDSRAISSNVSSIPNIPTVSSAPAMQPSSFPQSGMAHARPAPVAFTRPPTTTGSLPRPTTFPKDTATAPTATPATVAAPPRPNVSSPAPPSAGVLDQITSHRRFTDDSFNKNNGASGHTAGHTAGGGSAVTSNLANIAGVGTVASSSNAASLPPSPMAGIKTSNVASGITGHAPNSSHNITSNGTAGHAASGLLGKPAVTTPAFATTASTTSNNMNGSLASSSKGPVAQGIGATPGGPTNATPNKSGRNLPGSFGSTPATSISNNAAGHVSSGLGGNLNTARISMAANPTSTVTSSTTSAAPINVTGSLPSNTTSSLPGTTAPTPTARAQSSNSGSNTPSLAPARASASSSTSNTMVNPTRAITSGLAGSASSPNSSVSNSISSTPRNSVTSSVLSSAVGQTVAPTFAKPESVGAIGSYAQRAAGSPVTVSGATSGSTGQSNPANSILSGGNQTVAASGIVPSSPISRPSNAEAVRAATNMTNSIGNNVNAGTISDIRPTTNSHVGSTSSVESKNNSSNDADANKTAAAAAAVGIGQSMAPQPTAVERQEAPAFKAHVSTHSMSSPAPPSAGVVDQIAGHKRSLDEGPGSASVDQPEPKRLGISST